MTETFPRRIAQHRGPTDSMQDMASALRSSLGDHPAADLVGRCFTNTWETAMHDAGDGEVFVVTGDIPAMWLRDSTAQVRPYLALAGQDPQVSDALAGVSRRQIRNVLIDPYANAFNNGPTGLHADPHDEPSPEPWIWERKYEVDSLAAALQLAYALWQATGRTDHLDERFAEAARLIVHTWTVEQEHERSHYTFRRNDGPFAGDTLERGGRGGPVTRTGMTWSGFRPSDDRCAYGYLVPANALASVSLHGLSRIARTVLADEALAVRSVALADEIDAGITGHGRVEVDGADVLAYEVDGLGNALVGDDANLPSLLALPWMGWCRRDDPLYQATRALVLSPANPWFYSGRSAAGIGSPHTVAGHVWPLAIAMEGLTATDDASRLRALTLLARTTAGTGLMHESFHVDDPGRYTRAWFGWANAMFTELAMEVSGQGVSRFFPRRPETPATAVRAGADTSPPTS